MNDSKQKRAVLVAVLLIVGLLAVGSASATSPSATVEAWQSSSSMCSVGVTGSLGDGETAADRVIIEGDRRGTETVTADDERGGEFSKDVLAQRGSTVEVYAVSFEADSVEVLATGYLTDDCSFSASA